MNISIHKLSAQVGLTSRTLRHWEAEGLFCSMRDKDSGWRVYDETATHCIYIIALLRKLDVPIKEIKAVLDEKTYACLCDVIKKQISALRTNVEKHTSMEKCLIHFLSVLEKEGNQVIEDIQVLQLLKNEMEEKNMLNAQNKGNTLQVITLPPMRVVYNIAVSISPEGEAMNPVLEWLEAANLTGTARLFGGDMPPMPSGEGKPYGYGMCASIPEGVGIPNHLKEMRLPGGLYARLESTDDIPGSWQELMRQLSADDKYESDNKARLCLEEHIRNDMNGFLIILLEPVKAKY
ncbi:MAG: MerR family transcriptional regulator [Lachnospiraceae bacterium]|nr:MerR family transcriptional regulator [Lachnospiraceae bacterium]